MSLASSLMNRSSYSFSGTTAIRRILILCMAGLIGVVSMALCVADVYAAEIIYVKTVVTGSGDGSSWDNATTLQDALQNLAEPGDEIWVAKGLYKPGTAQTDTFELPAGVAVYGGFSGVETARTQRDWEANPTVLSGDIAGDDIVDANGVVTDTANIVGDNSYHVVFAVGTSTPIDAATVLDGFTITGGKADGTISHFRGGGLYCDGRSGGVCSPVLANIVFSANTAIYGGALYSDGEEGVSNPRLVNVAFYGNEATDGGAMYNLGNRGESSPELIDVTFSGNTASSAGALFNNGERGKSSPILTNVVFAANTAELAGAMLNEGSYGESSPTLNNIVFSANSADNAGAMWNDGYHGISNPILTNVSFSANFANDTGGAMINSGTFGSCQPTLTNVIVWGNDAGNLGKQLYNAYANPVVAFSLVEGGINGNGVYNDNSTVSDGGGNLAGGPTDDPLFVEPVNANDAPTAAGNLRLQSGSPAIDAGSNDAIALSTDVDGNPRKVDGNNDGVAVVDLGAYETQILHDLIVEYAGNGSGKVVPDPTGSACASPCIGAYPAGTAVTLSAIADAGSVFSHWSGDLAGTDNPIALLVDSSKTITATFIKGGSLQGIVVDEDDKPLDGVTAVLSSEVSAAAVKQEQQTVTDATGSYRFDDLLPSSYTLTFLKLGFQISEPAAVQVKAEQTTSVDDVVMESIGGGIQNVQLPAMHNAP